MTNKNKSLIITGPFATNYSLAKVNRGLAVALAKLGSEYKVNIWADPQKIDRYPSGADLKKLPEVESILISDHGNPDVVIFNNYPKSPNEPYGLKDLPGKTKIMYLAWEESVFPKEKVDEINNYAHGLMVASSFVKQIMRKNGIKIPIKVVLNAINDAGKYTPKNYPLETQKTFKFLHISTAKRRKGIDVLLKAYFEEFTKNDDTVLVVKSFPGPENTVNELLAKFGKEYPNAPDVIHIFDPNLTEEELTNLTFTADCVVYPSRAEGFGLPIAEAMYQGVPVIATNYSGYLDFCNEDCAFMVDYDLKPAIESEATNIGAVWAEPNLSDLRKQMRYVFENRTSVSVGEKIKLAKERALQLTWENSAKSALEFIKDMEKIEPLKEKSLAVVTTYNTVCGLAEYSADLYSPIEKSFKTVTYIANSDVADRVRDDKENVVRLWEYGEQKFDKVLNWIDENKPDFLHLQIHSTGHYPISGLVNLINGLQKLINKPKLVITPHTVLSQTFDLSLAKESLNKSDLLFVHKEKDYDYLLSKGVKNMTIFPLPYDEYPQRNKNKVRTKLGLEAYGPIIATHGLISEHKGLLQIIDAIGILKEKYPDIMFLSINAVNINNSTSAATYERMLAKTKELKLEENILFFTDFLDKDEILVLIQAADVGVLAYEERGESASAAIRKFLASGIPTIVTDIPMMSEVQEGEVLKIVNNPPENIAVALEELCSNKHKSRDLAAKALSKSSKYSWSRMGIEMLKQYVG